MTEQFDLIVVGAGPGGYPTAIKGAKAGFKTAIIENREVGGTCLNRGCIPTKVLLHSAILLDKTKEFSKIGIETEETSLHIDQVYQHKEATVAKLRGGVEQLLKGNGIAYYQGTGSLAGNGVVRITNAAGEVTEISGTHIVLATGSVPSLPPIDGIETPGVCTSDDLLAGVEKVPERLVIVGGGVIGVEFATAFAAFGSKITIIEAMDRILPTLDREISLQLAATLKKKGIEIFTGAMVEKIAPLENGLQCSFKQKEAAKTVDADCILISIGRRANSQGLGLEEAGVATDRGRILVDSDFRTNVPGIYAIGDVIPGIQLAHVATAQGSALVEMLAKGASHICLDVVPSCIYTDPEIATVGLSSDEATKAGYQVVSGKFPMAANGKTVIEGQDRGFIKLVVDADTDKVLGAQMFCQRATDMIGELALAIANGLTRADIAKVIHPHPTFCEAILEVAEDVVGEAVHVAPRRR